MKSCQIRCNFNCKNLPTKCFKMVNTFILYTLKPHYIFTHENVFKKIANNSVYHFDMLQCKRTNMCIWEVLAATQSNENIEVDCEWSWSRQQQRLLNTLFDSSYTDCRERSSNRSKYIQNRYRIARSIIFFVQTNIKVDFCLSFANNDQIILK